MTTAIVCGSHLRGDRDYVFAKLDEQAKKRGIRHIVCGGADYIDTFAIMWAMDRKVSFSVEYARWEAFGKQAGSIRNTWMLDRYNVKCIIAFDGDNGTRDMMAQARARGINVYQV